MTRLPHPLVSADALKSRLADGEEVTLLDVRWGLGEPSKRSAYLEGHIPGAAWVEFEEALSSPAGSGGRHPMPDAATFTHAMRAAGVRNDRPVAIYDGGNALAAARCWWLLRYFGKLDVQVLDGGLPSWLRAGGTLTDEVVEERGNFVATPGHLRLVDANRAAELAAEHILIDGRPADRFRGENEIIDPVAGHIPGAINLPALKNVDANGVFLPTDDLAMRFGNQGLHKYDEVGVYCGSGVQAMHLALALEVSGVVTNPAVYVGSWSEWITDDERPIEVGPARPHRHKEPRPQE